MCNTHNVNLTIQVVIEPIVKLGKQCERMCLSIQRSLSLSYFLLNFASAYLCVGFYWTNIFWNINSEIGGDLSPRPCLLSWDTHWHCQMMIDNSWMDFYQNIPNWDTTMPLSSEGSWVPLMYTCDWHLLTNRPFVIDQHSERIHNDVKTNTSRQFFPLKMDKHINEWLLSPWRCTQKQS